MSAVADAPGLGRRFVWLIDLESRRSKSGQSMPAKGRSPCIDDVQIDIVSGADGMAALEMRYKAV
jgi:hypothetical protein